MPRYLIAAFFTYKSVSESQRTNTEISNINYLKHAIFTLYPKNVSNDYKSVNAETLILAKAVPEKMIKNESIYNVYGYPYTISGIAHGQTSNGNVSNGRTMFFIGSKGVTKAGCIRLSNQFWNDALFIGASSSKSNLLNNLKATEDQKIDRELISETCNNINNDNGLTVVFSFR